MKFIVFVDALDYNDVQAASNGWFKQYAREYIPNVPRVTPNVISQIMTGKRQEDLPFVRSTPYKKPRKFKIECDTILHHAANKGFNVLQYGIPLCANIDLPDGSISIYDHFLRQQAVPAALQFVQAKKDFKKGDLDDIFNAFVDEAVTMFSSMRNVARNGHFDVVFIGYQPIDAYTHMYDEDRRRDLIKVVESELHQVQQDLGVDILFFSDHGSMPKKATFRINKWLKDNGWLDYEVNYKLLDFHRAPGIEMIDQIILKSPFVYIDWDNTKFYCADAFDSMVDATDKATKSDKDKLVGQLLETGYFDGVKLKEQFDGAAECYGDLPDVIPEAAPGVSVSCNIHKNAEVGNNIENLRKGWHSKHAVIGCTDDSIDCNIDGPADIFGLMREFIDKDTPRPKSKQPDVILDNLHELGYM